MHLWQAETRLQRKPQELLAAPTLCSLVLSCNMLHTLEGLDELPALTHLNVSYNLISSLTVLAVRLPSIASMTLGLISMWHAVA
jgi:Leucine-rich repeat (LRR) protein